MPIHALAARIDSIGSCVTLCIFVWWIVFLYYSICVYRFFLRFPWPAVPFSRVSPILLPQEHVSHLSNDFFAYSRVGHVKVTCARGSRVCTLHPPHIHTHIHINPPPFVPYTPIFGPLCTIIISHIVLLSHLSLLHRIGSVLPHALPYHTPALLTREGMDSLFFHTNIPSISCL